MDDVSSQSNEDAKRVIEQVRQKSMATWNPATKAVTKEQQLDRAALIQRTLGTKVAARYMRSNGWSFEACLWWLQHAETRND